MDKDSDAVEPIATATSSGEGATAISVVEGAEPVTTADQPSPPREGEAPSASRDADSDRWYDQAAEPEPVSTGGNQDAEPATATSSGGEIPPLEGDSVFPEPLQARDRAEAYDVFEDGTVQEARAFLAAHKVGKPVGWRNPDGSITTTYELGPEFDDEAVFEMLETYATGDTFMAPDRDSARDFEDAVMSVPTKVPATAVGEIGEKEWGKTIVWPMVPREENSAVMMERLFALAERTGGMSFRPNLKRRLDVIGYVQETIAADEAPSPDEDNPEERPSPSSVTGEKTAGLVGVMFVPASEIKPRVQPWLWDGRIPTALPTLLVGMQGLGKSTLTSWLAARVSRGELGEKEGTVLILSAEDDPETTVVPRLIAAGADLERVQLHRVERSLTFPKDIELLDAAVLQYGATFVVVDPIMAYLDAETDAYQPQDVRRTLRAINTIAQSRRVTVLPLMHFRKESANEVLHMVTSSSAFTEAPRSVLGLGRQPEAGDGNLALVHLKCNVGPRQKTLAVTIEPATVPTEDGEQISTSYVRIGTELDLTAEDVFKAKQGRPADARSEAKTFLATLLAKFSGRIPAPVGLAEWKAYGLGSPDTLKRARKDLGLTAIQGDDGAWYWVEEF